ncbi:MAG TPA: energy transducer TonB [Opitutales bacterium]|nr:energy transducer TonB [Opitutales bacterium]
MNDPRSSGKSKDERYQYVTPSIATSILVWVGVSLFLHFCLTCALLRPVGIRPPRVYLGCGAESVDAYFVRATPALSAQPKAIVVEQESLNIIQAESGPVLVDMEHAPEMAKQETAPAQTDTLLARSETVEGSQQELAPSASPSTQSIEGEQSTFASRSSEGTLLAKPTPNYCPTPRYPKHAREAGYEGTVRAEVFVDAKGVPTNVKLLQSSGHSELDDCALRTIQRRWRFIPAERFGQKVPASVTVAIEFSLKNLSMLKQS